MPSRNHVRIIPYNCLFAAFQTKATDTEPSFQHQVLAAQSKHPKATACAGPWEHTLHRGCVRDIAEL